MKNNLNALGARGALVLAVALLATIGRPQAWSTAYNEGLTSLTARKYAEARDAFQRAAAIRPQDSSKPTNLPGPVTERRRWRNGAPYSPNFAAAYAAFRQAVEAGDATERKTLATTAANEMEALIKNGQAAQETFFFASQSYVLLSDTEGMKRLETALAAQAGKLTWRIDRELLLPEELAAINAISPTPERDPPQGIDPGVSTGLRIPTVNPTGAWVAPTLAGRVAQLPSKYALIIANAKSKLPEGALSFAGTDADRMKTALSQNAGYPEGNIEVLKDVTAAGLTEAVKSFAAKLPQDATVLIYFSGAGVNIDGKDYLAGIDTESTTDSSSMLAKTELYRPFLEKEAKIFAFFQANRPSVDGRYFGTEEPRFGQLAQMQATIRGQNVLSTYSRGEQIGLFTEAFIGVIETLRSNRIPIQEFAWQLFDRIRKGGAGLSPGSSRQTPVLPNVTNLAVNAGF